MFDTPFDRQADQVAEERRAQHIAEILDGSDPEEGVRLADRPLMPRRKRLWLGIALVAAVLAAWWLIGSKPEATATAGPPVVTAAHPLQREITEWDEFVGRFEASRSVEVRPQVSGEITRVHFTDGQFVQQGAPLFTIDSRTYRAALAEARAEDARAESALDAPCAHGCAGGSRSQPPSYSKRIPSRPKPTSLQVRRSPSRSPPFHGGPARRLSPDGVVQHGRPHRRGANQLASEP